MPRLSSTALVAPDRRDDQYSQRLRANRWEAITTDLGPWPKPPEHKSRSWIDNGALWIASGGDGNEGTVRSPSVSSISALASGTIRAGDELRARYTSIASVRHIHRSEDGRRRVKCSAVLSAADDPDLTSCDAAALRRVARNQRCADAPGSGLRGRAFPPPDHFCKPRHPFG
jgi:hypothetical protein